MLPLDKPLPLLPCPFCGSSRSFEDFVAGTGCNVRYITCQDCHARGPWSTFQTRATEQWERRAQSSDGASTSNPASASSGCGATVKDLRALSHCLAGSDDRELVQHAADLIEVLAKSPPSATAAMKHGAGWDLYRQCFRDLFPGLPAEDVVSPAALEEMVIRLTRSAMPSSASALSRSRAALPADVRKTLEESNLPIEVATAIADLCEARSAMPPSAGGSVFMGPCSCADEGRCKHNDRGPLCMQESTPSAEQAKMNRPDRGDAVNLARSIVEGELPLGTITPIGITLLAEGLLRLDAAYLSLQSATTASFEPCERCDSSWCLKAKKCAQANPFA